MIVKFDNSYLEKLFQGKAVSGKPRYSDDVIVKFKKTILILRNIDSVKDLRKFQGLNFEALKGNFRGYYSVRVDYKYRLILSIEKDRGLIVQDILIVEDLTNHYQ